MQDEVIGFDEGEDLSDRDVFTLDLGDGEEHDFVVLVVVDHEEHSYALLVRCDHLELDEPSAIETIVARFDVDADGDEVVRPIEDSTVYDEVWKICARFADLHESA